LNAHIVEPAIVCTLPANRGSGSPSSTTLTDALSDALLPTVQILPSLDRRIMMFQ
jgi:hypothetical protein